MPSNTFSEIVQSKLVLGVSTQGHCESTEKFVNFVRDNNESLVSNLDCFEHDILAKATHTEPDPTYVCGVLLGNAFTGVCHIDPEAIKEAQKIFNAGLEEYNSHTLTVKNSEKILLTPQLILFGEGITQWAQN